MKKTINKKAGLSISSFLMAIIFISIFSLGILSLTTDSFNNLGITLEAPYNQTQEDITNNFNAFTAYANDTAKQVESADVSSTTVGLINIGSLYNAGKTIFKIPSLLIGLFGNLFVSFGISSLIPLYVLAGIIAILLIYLAFKLFAVVFKREL